MKPHYTRDWGETAHCDPHEKRAFLSGPTYVRRTSPRSLLIVSDYRCTHRQNASIKGCLQPVCWTWYSVIATLYTHLGLILIAGDDYTANQHSDTYPAIDSSKANLCGKNVFICGASKGIGRATTLSFAKAGASCIAIGARSDQVALEKDIKDAAVAAKKDPPKVLQIKLDVTDQKSVERAASDVEQQFGRLDILVHNAGVLGTSNPIVDSDPENWWRTWNVNLRGPYLVTRAFLPLMLKEGDKQIVNVSSVGSHLTSPGLSSYQTSKLALLRFTEFVVSEYGEKGVLAFSIHPGNILGTDIMDAGDVPDSIKHSMLSLHNMLYRGTRRVLMLQSFHRDHGAPRRYYRLLDSREARLASREVHQLHLGYARTYGKGG